MNKATKKVCAVFLIIAICGSFISLFAYLFSVFGDRKIPLDDASERLAYENSVDNVYIKAKNTVIRISKGDGENYILTQNIPRISYKISVTQRKISYISGGGLGDFIRCALGVGKNEKYSGIHGYIPQKLNYPDREIQINVAKSHIVKYELDLKNCTVYFKDIDTLSDYVIRGKGNKVCFENVSGESYIWVDENENSVYFG